MGVSYERAGSKPAPHLSPPILSSPIAPVEQFFHASLLGLLTSGFLALAFSEYLDLPTIVLTAVGLVIRAVTVFRRRAERWQLSSSLANALTLAYIGFYPLDYLYLSGEFIPATVHLICFLAVVRLLSSRTNRDYFFVKVIAFLELVAATLLSSNVSFFVFLTLFVVFGVATFCCSEIRRSSQLPRRIATPKLNFHARLAALTAVVTVGIVVMTAGLFVILPRTARAAFRSLVPEKYHMIGFANEVSLGQLGSIQQSTTPLLHVKIEDVNRQVSLKWRGGVLTQFDGRRWYNPVGHNRTIPVESGHAIVVDDDQRRRLGRRLSYQVRINSLDADNLFFAGVPEVIHINLPVLFRTPEGAFRTGLGTGLTQPYYATSFLPELARGHYQAPPLSTDAFNELLLLPDVDRRIVELARSLDPGGATADRAEVLATYLRTRFSYTTELLDREVPDPLAHFMFDRRAGHCEYFASALAVMLRALHIPARIVTGFQSGVYNPMTGWHVLRASDAHSWVEAWSPGDGWLTFDPTPPSNSPQGKPWGTFALYMDAAEMWWQRWVMDYNLDHQLYLASRVQQSTRGWNRWSAESWWKRADANVKQTIAVGKRVAPWMALLISGAVVLWFLAPAMLATFRRSRYARRIRQGGAGASDAAILYMQMLAVLRRRGFEKPAWLTPLEFARVLPDSPTSQLVREFTAQYLSLRYGADPTGAEQMLGLLQQIESASTVEKAG